MRAQMEIMGLAIIIVIISLGVFFAVALYEPEPESVKDYTENIFTTNFVLAVLQTNLALGSGTIEDAVRSCGKGNDKDCRIMSAALKIITKEIIAEEQFYRLTVKVGDKELYPGEYGTPTNCDNTMERSLAGYQPIPLFTTGGAQAIMELSLCS